MSVAVSCTLGIGCCTWPFFGINVGSVAISELRAYGLGASAVRMGTVDINRVLVVATLACERPEGAVLLHVLSKQSMCSARVNVQASPLA